MEMKMTRTLNLLARQFVNFFLLEFSGIKTLTTTIQKRHNIGTSCNPPQGLKLAMFVATVFSLQGCAPSQPNDLDKLGTVKMSLGGKNFDLWVADAESERLRGLMFVSSDQMATKSDGTERGMIFAFDHSVRSSFWMKNTIIPLDIAYLDVDGEVITIHTMIPLDDRINQYPPDEPYRFAVEVNGSLFGKLGLKKGDKLQIPASLLKGDS